MVPERILKRFLAFEPVQKEAQGYGKRLEKRIIGPLAAHFSNHGIEKRFNGTYNGSTRQKKYREFNGSNSFITHDHCGNIMNTSTCRKNTSKYCTRLSPFCSASQKQASSAQFSMSKNIQLVGKTFALVKHSIHRPKSREHSSALCPWEITLRVLAALAKKLEPQIRGVTICYIQGSHNLLGY
jgi:hypothetical protein